VKRILILSALLLAGCHDSDETAQTPQAPQTTAPPLVVLFATDAETTLNGDVMYTVVPTLKAAGFEVMALDAPCHGADAIEGEADPLWCWRVRIANGVNPFKPFCEAISRELDRRGVTQVDAVGQSRGGYLAVTCAAADPRFRNVALLKPVTDLRLLSEFDGLDVDQSIYGLEQYEPEMRSINTWLRIGTDDQRVGTQAAVSFGEAIGAEVSLSDTPGHTMQDEGLPAEWLKKQHANQGT
jgi:pimeloyl-ACP methyl ester carboxylesterase